MTIQLPESYYHSAVAICGKEILPWIDTVPSIIDHCTCCWELSSLELSANLSVNVVLFCKSKTFGSCVLKICVPGPEYGAEKQALALYGGNNACKLYCHDDNVNALLLEKFESTADLRAIQDFSHRIEIAATILKQSPVKLNPLESHTFPSYRGWLEKALLPIKKEGIHKELIGYADFAMALLNGMEDALEGGYLLHGDLHHQNILLTDKGPKIIDPKGVTGFKALEAGRFLLNELWMHNGCGRQKSGDLLYITYRLAEAFACSPSTIFKCFYIALVLSTCWSVDAGIQGQKYEEELRNCRFVREISSKQQLFID